MEPSSSAASPNKRKYDSENATPEESDPQVCGREESNEPSHKKAKADLNLEEERHFFRLFNEVLDRVKVREKLADEEIRDAVNFIKLAFQRNLGHSFSEVDLRQADKICGYLFRYGSHGAGLTRYRMLEGIRNCKALVSILRSPKLQVVCLGGGPGNDAVGFCSALHELDLQNRVLKFTVVDAALGWSCCVRLVKDLVTEGSFGNVTELFRRNEVDMSFVRARLPAKKKDDKVCYDAMKNADIILVTKLLSILDWSEKDEVIENLHWIMKDKALVLFIDSPFQPDKWNKFDILYLSEEDKYYQSEEHCRFECWNTDSSKARIAVLRKQPSSDSG